MEFISAVFQILDFVSNGFFIAQLKKENGYEIIIYLSIIFIVLSMILSVIQFITYTKDNMLNIQVERWIFKHLIIILFAFLFLGNAFGVISIFHSFLFRL